MTTKEEAIKAVSDLVIEMNSILMGSDHCPGCMNPEFSGGCYPVFINLGQGSRIKGKEYSSICTFICADCKDNPPNRDKILENLLYMVYEFNSEKNF